MTLDSRLSTLDRSGRSQRNGVTLLFVVSMIVLFLLMGTTFVIVSSNFSRSARMRAVQNIGSIDSSDGHAFVERALYEIVRGPALDNTASPLRTHSLLADMYGYGFSANVSAAAKHGSQHFVSMRLDFAGSGKKLIDGSSFTPDPISAMSGLVLTVTTGAHKGLTTRIVDHQVSGSSSTGYQHTLILLPLWSDSRFNVDDANELVSEQAIVNGRPFSGTGAGGFNPAPGFNGTTARSNPALGAAALQPNQTGIPLAAMLGAGGYLSSGNSTSGYAANSIAPNEPYDAFDIQNLALAGINPNGTVNRASFYRPSLTGAPFDPRGDFRAFKFGGPGNNGVMVDNDNNGYPDGIWMDIGLPSLSGAGGTRYKPLVSVTAVDLDGRINVNAHGNYWELDRKMEEIALLGLPPSGTLHRGQGYGPPEIGLTPLLGSSSTRMLAGSTDGVFPGRYGFDPEVHTTTPPGLPQPGKPFVRDDWSSYKLYGFPNRSLSGTDPNNPTAPPAVPGTLTGHFATPMDLHGRFAIGYPNDIRDVTRPPTGGASSRVASSRSRMGLQARPPASFAGFSNALLPAPAPSGFPVGLPIANVSTSELTTEAVDSAYEMSFADDTMGGPRQSGFDTPFTPRELEGVLRRADPDSNLLENRLWELGSGSFSGGSNPAVNSITTASFEVPTTIENLPFKLYTILVNNGDSNPQATAQALLPPESFRGLPMNVNRPFGDGIDNDNNGLIDEIGEPQGKLFHPADKNTSFDFDEDNDSVGSGDADAKLARVKFARHLYIVTLLSTEKVDRNGNGSIGLDDWYDFNADGTTTQQDLIDYRKSVAQWAINVVDFRDTDSVMTGAEFDLNPWDGWGVDDDLATIESSLGAERHVVWGTERPELLITETFASHATRTQDTGYDSTNEQVAPIGADDDFDSHLVPEVSAFFELYNPWVVNDANQIRPAELYDANLAGVDLKKKTSDGSPVWRLTVTGHGESDLDPDDETNNPNSKVVPGQFETATSVRRIYFTQPDSAVDSGPAVYFPDPDDFVAGFGSPAILQPGLYAVVGSAGVKRGGSYNTYFGRRTDISLGADGKPTDLKLDETRRISLDASNAMVEVHYWNEGDNKMDVKSVDAVCLPIGANDGDPNESSTPRNLGISDPEQGYADMSHGGLDSQQIAIDDGFKYVIKDDPNETDLAFDEPVDRLLNQVHFETYLTKSGLHPGYRTVHLQRLANPLATFDQKTNPYLTIDSTSMDLFVFNGVETADDPNDDPGPLRMGSFERRSATKHDGSETQFGQQLTTGRFRMLFKNDLQGHQTPNEDDTKELTADRHILSRNFAGSLGQLNTAWAKADPDKEQPPFAALTWNNRPFASQLELVNVPFTSSYWLPRRFDVATKNRSVYSPPVADDATTQATNHSGQFPHLFNFYSDHTTGTSRLNSPSLHRVFDYLEVPSRFVGTESYVNPAVFSGNRHGLSFGLSTPFDTISNYRYPGKLNINTVLDPRVWQGLMRQYALEPTGAQTDPVKYTDWVASRNGNSGIEYGNPYRSPLAANRVPAGRVVDPVECGLFRSGPGGEPLFDYAPDQPQQYNDSDRTAYFRYDMRQRLGNLVTSRSSVFAIWITVGYFEVDPDGSLRLGTGSGVEVGSETGEIERHRGFYLLDRSIPVAFEPGKNHNVDRAILVRSIIQ